MEALKNVSPDLIFPKPTRFHFYYNRGNNAPTMRFCIGALYFECKKLKLLCPTEAVFDKEGLPRALMEGYTTRIQILPDDEYIVFP